MLCFKINKFLDYNLLFLIINILLNIYVLIIKLMMLCKHILAIMLFLLSNIWCKKNSLL